MENYIKNFFRKIYYANSKISVHKHLKFKQLKAAAIVLQ